MMSCFFVIFSDLLFYSYNEIETAQEIRYRRCFDRVIEMCPIVITLDKAGRRPEIAQEKKQVAMRILSGH